LRADQAFVDHELRRDDSALKGRIAPSKPMWAIKPRRSIAVAAKRRERSLAAPQGA